MLNDPQYWRAQAEEMGALASGMKDNITRQAMFRIASDYELLAKRHGQRGRNFETERLGGPEIDDPLMQALRIFRTC